MDSIKRYHLSRVREIAILFIAIAVVVAIGIVSFFSAEEARGSTEQIEITRDILSINGELLSVVKDAETGQRGFLVTGQEQYLAPYSHAVSSIPGLLRRFEQRTATRRDQADRVKALEPVVAAKLREMNQTVVFRRAKNAAAALAIVDAGVGKALMDDIRARCAEIDRVAYRRLTEYSAAADRSTSTLRMVSTFGSLVLFGLIISSAVTISRGLKRREELFHQAHASQELLATTLSSIADAVISTDAAAKITFMNPVAEKLTGWREKEALGLPVADVFSIVNETSRDKVANPLERAIAQGTPVGLANHTKLVSLDGTECFIDDSAAPICDALGRIIGGVLVFRDVSAKRRSELELAQSAANLQRSNEELQQFAFAASHDLRSPLNSANSVAQLLAKRFGEALGEEGNQMIGFITEGLSRMSRLVEDLLALATAGTTAPDVSRPTSVQEALEAVLRNLSAGLKETGATVTFLPLPMVAARDTHVIQTLQNIVGNALKYRGAAPPRIHISGCLRGMNGLFA